MRDHHAMTITDESLDSFIAAYERANGERLSREEALDAAMRVLAFVKLLSLPQISLPQPDEPARQGGRVAISL